MGPTAHVCRLSILRALLPNIRSAKNGHDFVGDTDRAGIWVRHDGIQNISTHKLFVISCGVPKRQLYSDPVH